MKLTLINTVVGVLATNTAIVADAINLVPQFLRRGNNYATETTTNENNINEDGWSLEQCYPSDLPEYTYQGNDYIFRRQKYNSMCVDTNNKQYQWGKVLGVNPPIDEPNSGCSKVCISGYGRGEQRGCSSMKPNKLVGFNYNCDEAACYCLYEKNTWSGNSSPCFDSMNTSYNGQGDVSGTKTNQGTTCYSLNVQSAPTPNPPPGSSICTYSPDYDCYKSGWPPCCDDDEYECPSFPTMCDNHGEGMSGTSYCTWSPQYGCDPATWSNNGRPKCCSAPGGDIMNCPKEQPPCNPDTDEPTPSPTDNDDNFRGTGRACDYKQCTNKRNVNACPPSMCDIDNGETCVKGSSEGANSCVMRVDQGLNGCCVPDMTLTGGEEIE